MQQQEPNHFVHLRGNSYTEIRDKIRELAEEHGFHVTDALAAAGEAVRRTADAVKDQTPGTADTTGDDENTGKDLDTDQPELAKKVTYLINADADETMKVRKGEELPSEDDGWVAVSKKQFDSYNDGLAQRKEKREQEENEEEEQVAEEKLYCIHEDSDSAFIVEEGEPLPGPDVDIVDRKKFRKFCVENDLDPATGKPEDEDEDDDPGASSDDDEEITQDDLKTAAGELVEAKGAAVAKKLVEEFKASKLSDIKKADYPAFMAAVRKKMKG